MVQTRQKRYKEVSPEKKDSRKKSEVKKEKKNPVKGDVAKTKLSEAEVSPEKKNLRKKSDVKKEKKNPVKGDVAKTKPSEREDTSEAIKQVSEREDSHETQKMLPLSTNRDTKKRRTRQSSKCATSEVSIAVSSCLEEQDVNDIPDDTNDTLVDKQIDDDDDSDQAPDDVTFAAGKEKAINRINQVKKQVKAVKNEVKLKRKKQQEKFIGQKKAKIDERQKLEDLRLPDSVLRDLDDEKSQSSDVEDKDDNSGHKKSDVQIKNRIKDRRNVTHGTTDFKVCNLIDEVKKPVEAAEEAASFRAKMLLGDHIKRESSTDMKLKLKKIQIAGSNRHVITEKV